jgi:hypothetical protein
MDDKQRQEELQTQIESAMQNGAKLNEIINHLSSSEDPLHQQFAKRLRGDESQDQTYKMQPIPTDGLNTPLVNTAQSGANTFANLPVEQQIGYGLLGVGGLGALGLAGYAGKELIRNKISKANENPEFKRQNDIAERNILLKEQELQQGNNATSIEQARIEVEKAKAERIREQMRREQELHQQKILNLAKSTNKTTSSVTGQSADVPMEQKIAAEQIKLQPNELTGHLFNKYGTTPTTQQDLVIFANQSPQELRGNFSEELINEMNKGLIPKQAADAGVTPTTSVPEAQTLVTTAEAAKDPLEKTVSTTKVEPKAPLPTQIPANNTGIAPKTIADIQQQEKLSPLFQKHLMQQQELLKNNTQFNNALQKAYLSGKIQPDEFFVPGLGNMDNNVFNTLGPEGRRQALEYKGMTAYGKQGGVEYNDIVSKNIKDYAESLRKEIPVDLTTRESRIAQGLPHEKNYGPLGKPLKIAGIAGLAMLGTQLVNAKTPQEKREARRNIGDAVLPPSLTSNQLSSGVLPPNAYAESKKLGSPFHIFPNQGHGVMPPSAYER